MSIVVHCQYCRPFCIPDATKHSSRRRRVLARRCRRRYYVTSMATVLSAILLSAGLSSSWFSLQGAEQKVSATTWSNISSLPFLRRLKKVEISTGTGAFAFTINTTDSSLFRSEALNSGPQVRFGPLWD